MSSSVSLRLERMRAHMRDEGIHTAVIMSPDDQFYLTGFRALIYSRPILVLIDLQKISLIVPGLEEEHARHSAHVDTIDVYYEFPDKAEFGISYWDILGRKLRALPAGAVVGLDLGFTPAHIASQIGGVVGDVKDVSAQIHLMRYVKYDDEIAAMKEAGKLVNLGVHESLTACRAGVTELEMDAAGNQAIYTAASRDYPESSLDLMIMSPSGVARTNMPHVYSNTRRIESGDGIIHSRQVSLNGYRAELERTVIVGHPTTEQARAFEAIVKAQRDALAFIRPGVKAKEVDAIARGVFESYGYAPYYINRIGHGIGVALHEAPYLTYYNDLVLEAGMAFTIEPGIYVPGLGGFRHSDTVILHNGEAELITEYPYELEALLR